MNRKSIVSSRSKIKWIVGIQGFQDNTIFFNPSHFVSIDYICNMVYLFLMWPRIIGAFTNLDHTVAYAGTIGTVLLSAWFVFYSTHIIYLVALVMVCLTCLSYLIFHRRIIELFQKNVRVEVIGTKSISLIFNALFFILLFFSIVVLYVRSDLYVRPNIYFAIIALMSCTLTLEIFYNTISKRNELFILMKIILITISVTYSQQLLFPDSLIGVDPWIYQKYTEGMLSTGHIITNWEYSNMPLFNLFTGFFSLITGLSYKFSSILSVSLIQIICDLSFIFLIGRHVWNNKVGLMAALFLGMAVMHISEGVAPIATTFAATMMVMAVYLLLKNVSERSNKFVIFFLLVSIALILTHTITAACMAVVLVCFWIWPKIFNMLMKKKESLLVSSNLFMIFVVGMIGYWLYASGLWLDIAEAIKWAIKLDFAIGITPGPSSAILAAYVENMPLSNRIFQDLGMFVYFSIAIFGCLFFLSKQLSNSIRSTMAVIGILLLIIGFLPFSFTIGLMSRWWYYAEIFLAPMVGISFLIGIQIIKNYHIRAFALSLITFSLVSIMILNPFANFDSPAYSNESSIRFALVQSEMEGIQTLTHISDRTIATDDYYCYIIAKNRINTMDLSQHLLDNNFTALKDTLVVFRSEISDSPFLCLNSTYRIEYSPEQSAEVQGLFKVYDSDTVITFYG